MPRDGESALAMARRTQIPLPVKPPEGPFEYQPYDGDIEALCECMGRSSEDMLNEYPTAPVRTVLSHFVGALAARIRGFEKALASQPENHRTTPRTILNVLEKLRVSLQLALDAGRIDEDSHDEFEAKGAELLALVNHRISDLQAGDRYNRVGTPLNQSLRYWMPHIKEFFRKHSAPDTFLVEATERRNLRRFARLVLDVAIGPDSGPDPTKARKQFDNYLDAPYEEPLAERTKRSSGESS